MIKNLKHILVTLFFLNAFSIQAFATWSVIIIDPKTGNIGVAGASCTSDVSGIAGIIPGKGAIVVQAMSNQDAKDRGLRMIISGASADAILRVLQDKRYNPQQQQYAIICMKSINQPATFTGHSTRLYNNALTAYGVSVQGNTLANKNEVKIILDLILKAKRQAMPLDKILMLALEAGANAGGDIRCGSQKATSAFVTVMKPHDKPDDPFMYLKVYDIDRGSDSAVQLLRKKYDRWIQSAGVNKENPDGFIPWLKGIFKKTFGASFFS